ncbi:phosphoribosyl-ATP diphosphatase [Roseivivax isoporae]|uniref:Phosphoribosyl-ATP pyrophosphatase n=1 Tax=Roseivivax isoporae LMG 25204 TaxID=1449351 RepID=X7FDV4_9RHOB|nr:phosphoribosyl-ATP diphosphatase [Roseivivax isoporae]ETX30985.1 phosphoribosyl-ATP pyrophosphatase [Roseivivax isoporae LMG 25204]
MTLDELERIVAARASAAPGESWTATLLSRGTDKCAEKFGEEAVEAIVAAVRGDRAALTAEAADVLYHLLVLLHAAEVPVADVMTELAARQHRSGLAEKAARGTP